MLNVEPVPAFNDNYIWLIIQSDNNHVAIVDPGDAGPVLDRIQSDNLVPSAILITHHHGDHTGGVMELLRHYKIPVYGPREERIPGCSQGLAEGDRVDLKDLSVQFSILDMPGHTAGAIAYYGGGMVFVGDTLFMSGCGRLFEGTPGQMHHSLAKLAALPEATQVYCAHEYTLANLKFAAAVEPGNEDIQKRIQDCQSLRRNNQPTVPGSIALEKLTNPFMRTHITAVAEAADHYREQKLANEIDVFAAIRNWKDNF